MKFIGITAAVAGAIVAVLVGSYYGGIFGNKVQANYQKRVVTSQIEQHVRTADFGQAAYDHFFNLCASVQTKEQSIAALEEERAGKPSAQRLDEINASITANRIGRADDINQYNADARKSYTLGQFRAGGLPYTLDVNAKETTCTS